MCTHLPEGYAELPPALRLRHCIESLDRLHGFVGALRDSFELAATNNDEQLATRLYVVDYIDAALKSISGQLGDISLIGS